MDELITTRSVATSYYSNDVAIPADFLPPVPVPVPGDDGAPPPPISVRTIAFAQTPLPEYASAFAIVADNVLSAAECAQLLVLAEASVRPQDRVADSAWRPALVNFGGGHEAILPNYRRSERIVWDSGDLVARLWARLAPALPPDAAAVLAGGPARRGRVWRFVCLNERLRFLRYRPGDFFNAHYDGEYRDRGGAAGAERCTRYTLHLYLNDAADEVAGAELHGGATPFLSGDETRRLDVHPRAGRVLIFQHAGLLHSGAPVTAGVKYTVRTDIMYELLPEKE